MLLPDDELVHLGRYVIQTCNSKCGLTGTGINHLASRPLEKHCKRIDGEREQWPA